MIIQHIQHIQLITLSDFDNSDFRDLVDIFRSFSDIHTSIRLIENEFFKVKELSDNNNLFLFYLPENSDLIFKYITWLKNSPESWHIPVLVISYTGNEILPASLYRAGANIVISVNRSEEFRSTIHSFLELYFSTFIIV